MYPSLEISNLEKLYSDNPESVIFAFLAFRNLEQGNMQKAVSICEEGVKKHPQYPFGHFVLGLCYYHLKDYAKAKTHLEISTSYDDKNPQAWKLLVEINEQLNQSILAEECTLKYYLSDSFNMDALEKYQKEEIINFDVFEKVGETDSKEEKQVIAEEETASTEEETQAEPNIENLFDKQIEEEKNDSIFSEGEEGMFDETIENPPSRPEEHNVKNEKETTNIDKKEGNFTESDDFFIEEKATPKDSNETDESEEFLDYKSVIKDIIEENKDDVFTDLETELKAKIEMVDDSDEAEEISSVHFEEVQKGDSLVNKPNILSPTIGEIYIAQGRFDEAVDVFKKLLQKEPDNQKYQKKITDIQQIIEKQKSKPETD